MDSDKFLAPQIAALRITQKPSQLWLTMLTGPIKQGVAWRPGGVRVKVPPKYLDSPCPKIPS